MAHRMAWMNRVGLGVLGIVAFVACGDDGGGDGSSDAGPGMCPAVSCDDGVYCNGAESCDPTHPMAIATGCAPGVPPCGSDPCDEIADECGRSCDEPDRDGDGFDAIACPGGNDCDDDDPNVFPGATEVCDADAVDEDCNPATFGFTDADGDGQGSDACCNGTNCGTDCDDGDANVSMGRTEACDGIDNDCDTAVDEGVLATYYPDVDGDDFGDPDGATMMACAAPPDYAERGTDCDDSAAAVNPGATDTCDANGDNDCNPDTENPFDPDLDGFDTFNAVSCPSGLDCHGDDPLVYPGADEICDGKDSNCDGVEPVGCRGVCVGVCEGDCSDECTVWTAEGDCAGTCEGTCIGLCDGSCSMPVMIGEDFDEDGYLAVGQACSGGPDDALPRTDCDDLRDESYPEAPELCDRRDNDCDTFVDETYYEELTLPEEPMTIEGGAAPDLSCRGSRTRPTPGATTATTVRVEQVGLTSNLPGVTFQVWDADDASDLVCGAGCSVYTADGAAEATVTHPENATLAYVIPAQTGVLPLLSIFQPSQEPVVNGIADPSIAANAVGDVSAGVLAAQVTDCNGEPIASIQLRVYPSSDLPVCSVVPVGLLPGAYIARGFDPPMTATGELVTVEAWGRPSAGAPFELVGREQIRVRANTLSLVPLGPLRADGPPAP